MLDFTEVSHVVVELVDDLIVVSQNVVDDVEEYTEVSQVVVE